MHRSASGRWWREPAHPGTPAHVCAVLPERSSGPARTGSTPRRWWRRKSRSGTRCRGHRRVHPASARTRCRRSARANLTAMHPNPWSGCAVRPSRVPSPRHPARVRPSRQTACRRRRPFVRSCPAPPWSLATAPPTTAPPRAPRRFPRSTGARRARRPTASRRVRAGAPGAMRSATRRSMMHRCRAVPSRPRLGGPARQARAIRCDGRRAVTRVRAGPRADCASRDVGVRCAAPRRSASA